MSRHGRRVGSVLLVCIAFVLVGISVAVVANRSPAAAQVTSDWREFWEVQPDFNISVDSEGFEFPSSIAFVPNPGTSPKDPLYFVTELRGRVKVVTNDRSVLTFAEITYDLKPTTELPAISGEVGMAGVCLAPKQGYVFVTLAYRDSENILRNNVVRFDTEPETFSVAPDNQVDFADVFLPYRSVESHQIGPCQVRDDLLYVSVADGRQTAESQKIGSLLGKILRLTLDGKPVSTNPFYQDESILNARNYVWAMGFRNPFGLKLVGDRMFVADNGVDNDRFLQIRKGGNYLWDGSTESNGLKAEVVFIPGTGVGQIDYYDGTSGLFPSRFDGSFFVAITGGSKVQKRIPNIAVLPYDLIQRELLSAPTPLVQRKGGRAQIVAGIAIGPDGLYFAPMFPNDSGITAILKVTHDPDSDYPSVINLTETNPIRLMRGYGCFACHTVDGNGEGTIGPVLDRDVLVPRVMARLNSNEYAQAVSKVDQLDQEPFSSFSEARRNVEQAQGIEQVKLWLEYRIQEPRFDDAESQMPNLGVPKELAGIIAAYLAREIEVKVVVVKQDGFFEKIIKKVKSVAPRPTRANAQKYGLFLTGISFAAGGIISLIGYRLFIWLRKINRETR